ATAAGERRGLWNTQFHELYSPFKAHTPAIKSWSRKAYPPTKTTIDSLDVGKHFHRITKITHEPSRLREEL
ncbi:MAG: hypothetical protein KAQ62_11085, partial [Cyclobacteriaceae bacterium]|nr:hypothetical protein [Cyclobacteriaceae bacterium]